MFFLESKNEPTSPQNVLCHLVLGQIVEIESKQLKYWFIRTVSNKFPKIYFFIYFFKDT